MTVKVCLFSSTIGAYEGWLTLPEAPRKGQYITVVRHPDPSHWDPPGEYTYLVTHEMGWKPFKGKYVYCVVGQEQNNNEVIRLRDQYRPENFNPFSKKMCLNPIVEKDKPAEASKFHPHGPDGGLGRPDARDAVADNEGEE